MDVVLEHHIEIAPDTRGGRPHIAHTRLTVADVVIWHLRLGQALEEIAGRYEVSLAAMHAAMAYYYDHRAEIDQDIEADQAYAEAFHRNNPSRLQAKLNSITRG
jgi:uncharacterized protein (DUF433 family)